MVSIAQRKICFQFWLNRGYWTLKPSYGNQSRRRKTLHSNQLKTWRGMSFIRLFMPKVRCISSASHDQTILRNTYYYCYYSTLFWVFHTNISWFFLLEFEWQLVSRTFLSILADLNNVVVWMVSTFPLISKSYSSLTIPLGIFPSAPITTGITVTFMFHSFFSSLARSRYSSLFLPSFNYHYYYFILLR